MKSLLKAADVSLTVVSSAHADLDARTDVAAIRADHSCSSAGEDSSRRAMPGRKAASMTAATVAEQRFANQLEMLIPRLTRYARALTRDTDRANDLVQDVAVRAIEKQHLWQPETDLRAWLFTMMHNEFVDETRRNSRAERCAREWKLGCMEATKGRQIAHLELRDMEQALGELSEEKRQAVLLIGAEGMRYEDAAAVLDVPVGTVRSRISRGREELRQLTTGETKDERAAKLPASLPVPPPKDDRREPREVAEKRAEVIAALKAAANRDAALASIVPGFYPVTVVHRDAGKVAKPARTIALDLGRRLPRRALVS